MDAMSKPPPLA